MHHLLQHLSIVVDRRLHPGSGDKYRIIPVEAELTYKRTERVAHNKRIGAVSLGC